ncbi:MAG: DUF2312 domain-containing protein [Pseudomonadota bacterium]
MANNTDSEQLRGLVERIERLDEERRAIVEDINNVFLEAKASGFNTKIMRQVIALRRMDPQKRKIEEVERESYLDLLDG